MNENPIESVEETESPTKQVIKIYKDQEFSVNFSGPNYSPRKEKLKITSLIIDTDKEESFLEVRKEMDIRCRLLCLSVEKFVDMLIYAGVNLDRNALSVPCLRRMSGRTSLKRIESVMIVCFLLKIRVTIINCSIIKGIGVMPIFETVYPDCDLVDYCFLEAEYYAWKSKNTKKTHMFQLAFKKTIAKELENYALMTPSITIKDIACRDTASSHTK